MNIDIAETFAYLNEMAVAVLPLFGLFGTIGGVYLVAGAGKSLFTDNKGAGGPNEQGPNLSAVGIKLLIAAILFQFGTSILWTKDDLLAGIGTGARATMALVVVSSSPTWDIILKTSFIWLQIVGAIGMFKGFLLWNKAGSGNSQGGGGDDVWKGIVHVLGGAILINIGSS